MLIIQCSISIQCLLKYQCLESSHFATGFHTSLSHIVKPFVDLFVHNSVLSEHVQASNSRGCD